jgi:hypothetical protein
MIEGIQAIDSLWDRTENAVKRYQYALKVVESGEKVPIGNRTDRSSSKARKNRESGSNPILWTSFDGPCIRNSGLSVLRGQAQKVQAVGREFAAGYGAAEHADAEGLRGWRTSEDNPKKIWADVGQRVGEIGFCEVT